MATDGSKRGPGGEQGDQEENLQSTPGKGNLPLTLGAAGDVLSSAAALELLANAEKRIQAELLEQAPPKGSRYKCTKRKTGESGVEACSESLWRTWSRIGLTILAAACCLAADDVPQPPVRGRPPAFSGIVGAVDLRASAAPTEFPVENPITYKLRLQGPDSLATLAVPDLGKIRGFEARFAIRLLTERWLPREKTREFEFELRPKYAAVDAIPPFAFVYWVPGTIPPEGGYQTRYSQSIPIKVNPRQATPVRELSIEGIPTAAGEHELQFDFSADLLAAPSQPWSPSLGLVAVVALLPSVLVWFRVGRGWRGRRHAGAECAQTRELARHLAAVDVQMPVAEDKVRQILDSNRNILVEKTRGFVHGAHCQCRELLGTTLAYLFGGAPRELLTRLVQEARNLAAREEGDER